MSDWEDRLIVELQAAADDAIFQIVKVLIETSQEVALSLLKEEGAPGAPPKVEKHVKHWAGNQLLEKLSAMGPGTFSTAEISESSGIGTGYLRILLNTLYREGKVRRSRTGRESRWSVSRQGEP